MEYRLLGDTGIKVSCLSYRASSLGGVFHQINENEGIKTVHTALDSGINLIECSLYYGNKQFELLLGKALSSISRNKYYLSKVGRYWNHGQKSRDYSAGRVIPSIDESIQRMSIDYIDFIHCHNIESANKQQIIQETLSALLSQKDSGKIRFIGITEIPLDDLRDVINSLLSETTDTIITFCHYSLNDNSLIDYLDFFNGRKTGVINAALLSTGLLTEGGAPDWHPADAKIVKTYTEAAHFCKKAGTQIEKIAIQFSISNRKIPTTLIITANPENMKQDIKWFDDPIDMALPNKVLSNFKLIHRKPVKIHKI